MRLSSGGVRRLATQLLATAGLIVIAGIAGVVRLHQHPTTAPPSLPAQRPAAPATAVPLPAVPAEDLAAAKLQGPQSLVTPFQMTANDGTGKVLIGAYADSTRTVIFFRAPSRPSTPADFRALSDMSVYDSHGFLNGGSAFGRGTGADCYFALDLGPRPDQDGVAQITVTDTYPQEPFTAPAPSTDWAFRFSLKVHPATALSIAPTIQLHSWKVSVENLAATPSVIDFQAVVTGANNQQLSAPSGHELAVLLDASGNAVPPITSTGSITVPKQQLNPANYQNTRVHYQWPRPATAATYQLRLTGNGATQTITLQIPAP